MELRFLKGNWEFGKFKLQTKKHGENVWFDVPTEVEAESTNAEIAKKIVDKLWKEHGEINPYLIEIEITKALDKKDKQSQNSKREEK